MKWTRGTLAMPPCCYCRRPAREVEVSTFELTTTDIDKIPMCGTPPPRIRCAPGKGCNAEPWSRSGMHLRAEIYDGPPPFKRIRDNTYWNFAE
jgi:hypothetical protein